MKSFQKDPIFDKLIDKLSRHPYKMVMILGATNSGKSTLVRDLIQVLGEHQYSDKGISVKKINRLIDEDGSCVLVSNFVSFPLKNLNLDLYQGSDFVNDFDTMDYKYFFLDDYEFIIPQDDHHRKIIAGRAKFMKRLFLKFRVTLLKNKTKSILFHTYSGILKGSHQGAIYSPRSQSYDSDMVIKICDDFTLEITKDTFSLVP